MAGVAGGELASAVSRSGGFGFIGAGHDPISTVQQQLQFVRDETVGLGFLAWRLEELDTADALGVIDKAEVVWFAFGKRVGEWTRAAKDKGKTVFVLVTSVEEAKAANSFGADVLVVQGMSTVGVCCSMAADKITSRFRGWRTRFQQGNPP
jgi:nitronate monooxygenase